MDDISRVENEVSEIQKWMRDNFGMFGTFTEKLDALEDKLNVLEEKLNALNENIIVLKKQFEDKNNGSN